MRKALLFCSDILNPSLLSSTLPLLAARDFNLRSLSSSIVKAAAMPGVDPREEEWPANKVRDTFIIFFQEKGHVNWRSSPVVPLNDPTLLFANAGISFH